MKEHASRQRNETSRQLCPPKKKKNYDHAEQVARVLQLSSAMEHLSRDIEEVLVSEETIRLTVARLASTIDADYQQKQPLIVVCILKGAFIFCSDLVRKLQVRGIQHSEYLNAILP
jgi:hypothetical protein